MLQLLFADVTEPMTEIINDEYVKLREDLVVLKNSIFDRLSVRGLLKNSHSFSSSSVDGAEADNVVGLSCKTMPRIADHWIQTHVHHRKLSSDMKRYIESNPCFIVPVGNKGSSHEGLEWKISTSHAERCLMLNLNITQIRCYVMMKMILKSFLKHPEEKGLSSCMCKNLLSLCIEKTPSESPSNLLKMITLCIFELQKWIIHKHCPHFIESRNNLMGRRFPHSVHVWLRKQVQNIIHWNGYALTEITTDDLGRRLQTKLNIANILSLNAVTANEISSDISVQKMLHLALTVSRTHCQVLHALSSG
jgi:hypothetical protein